MKSAVEAMSQAKKVGRTAGLPFRQCWTPTPMGTIDPEAPEPMARNIAARIAEIQRKRGCGAYVFVDPQHQVYVLSEEKPAALTWVKERFTWLVGFYRTVRVADPRIPTLQPSVEGITEDVLDQIKQMGARA